MSPRDLADPVHIGAVERHLPNTTRPVDGTVQLRRAHRIVFGRGNGWIDPGVEFRIGLDRIRSGVGIIEIVHILGRRRVSLITHIPARLHGWELARRISAREKKTKNKGEAHWANPWDSER